MGGGTGVGLRVAWCVALSAVGVCACLQSECLYGRAGSGRMSSHDHHHTFNHRTLDHMLQ